MSVIKGEYINTKLSLLPDKPGVYFMKDLDDNIIYIGKAKYLKKRVSSYFNSSQKDGKTQALLKHIKNFDYIVTENEVEALILEAELVQKHQPHYNILLKDQKSFPFIAVTNEMYPRVVKARNVIKADSHINPRYQKYYGPFVQAEKAQNILRFIENNYKLRRSKLDFPLKNPKRPCLYHHINKCHAPCANKISEEDYQKIIDEIVLLLEGNVEVLIIQKEESMRRLAKELKFEEAKAIRDEIDLLKNITVEQNIHIPESEDKDIIGIYGERGSYTVVVLSVRLCKLIDKKSFNMEGIIDNAKETLRAFFMQYYNIIELIPKEIIIPFEPEDYNLLIDYLKQTVNYEVDLIVDNENKGLIKIANENAKHTFKERHFIKEVPDSHLEIKNIFKLKKTPSTIESFDIAHIQGSYTMAGMVRFVNGKSDNRNYRLFNIKTVDGIDDFASIKEAVFRRYKNLKNNNIQMPDIILIDGGRGQLNSAIEALKELDIKNQVIMALAKKFEEIYLPNRDDPIRLADNSSARLFLQRVRDETHRFVNTSHGNKRSREMLRSELEYIKGVGGKTIERLYVVFDSITAIKNASLSELTKVPGVSEKTAEAIFNHFRNKEN